MTAHSQKRQRTHLFNVWLSDAELANLTRLAAGAEMTRSAYMREALEFAVLSEGAVEMRLVWPPRKPRKRKAANK